MKKLNGKQLLYTICFFGFVMVEFFTKNPIDHGNIFGYFFERINNYTPLTVNSGFQQLARESVGLFMAVIILSHYSRKDLKKNCKLYGIWSVFWIIGTLLSLLIGSKFFSWYADDPWSFGYLYSDLFQKVILVNDCIYILFLVFVWGIVLITVLQEVFKHKKLPNMDKPLFFVWIGLMLLMLFSGSYYFWPLAYLVMFGCFYLTEFTFLEQKQIFHGALNGILIGFCVLQCYALITFPYTLSNTRYLGFNANSNWSSLFYDIVLGTVFIKIIYHTQKGASLWKKGAYWLLSGVVLSLEFFTIGKVGYITAVFECILLIVFISQSVFKKMLRTVLALVLSFVLMFPVTFAAVRYVPAYTPLSKGMQKYIGMDLPDSIDSDDYMSIDYLLESALGRVTDFVRDVLFLQQYNPFILHLSAEEDIAEVLPPNKIPVMESEEATNGFKVRTTIYEYYFKHLKLFGQPYDTQGFQLTSWYWIGHAHNIYLQYGTDFGIIALIIWLGIILKALFNCIKAYRRTRDITSAASIFFLTIPLVFGMFEYSWGNGALSITMMFISGWFILRSGLKY